MPVLPQPVLRLAAALGVVVTADELQDGTSPDPARSTFWSVELPQLLTLTQSGPDGLTQAEAEARRKAYGPNTLRTHRRNAWLPLLLNQFKSPLVLLLLFAMGLSFFLGEKTDAAIVLVIVLGSTLLGFFQEFRATNAVARLLDVITTRTTVLRDGREAGLPVEEVVPGDVVLLSAGDAIPADCALLEERDLFVDEAALTGESYPAEKHPGVLPADAPLSRRTNALFQGTRGQRHGEGAGCGHRRADRVRRDLPAIANWPAGNRI